MRRNEQVRRIRTLDVELSGCIERVRDGSHRPLQVMQRYGRWLLPGAGLAMGALLARVSARNVLARSISGAMLLLRARRLLVRWVRRA